MNLRDFFNRLRAAFHDEGQPFAMPTVPRGLSRRRFFGLMTAAAASAAVLDIDKLVWTPGEKTIFLPPAPVLASIEEMDHAMDAFRYGQLDMNWFTREALKAFENNLAVAKRVNRQYEARFTRETHRLGDTVRIALPTKWEYNPNAPIEPVTQNLKNVVLDHQLGADFDMRSIQAAGTRENIRRNVIEPMAAQMAARVNKEGVTVFGKLDVPSHVEQGVSVQSGGAAIRGMKYFDVVSGQYLVRLDILGGKC